MTGRRGWIETDLDGLAKVLERRNGKAYLFYELWQNCRDQKVTEIIFELNPIPHRPAISIMVSDDDPEGFADLSHAFTLFAESIKKGDPTKAGRFNIGEKFVLANCESAKIQTTTGTIYFEEDGTRRQTKENRKKGSIFSGIMRMTRKEYGDALEALNRLISPQYIKTTVNKKELPTRIPIVTFEASLLTEKADKEGNLRRTTRRTVIEVYQTLKDEIGTLYELNIPVLETGDKFHINITQKVPLNFDRDNVPPSFLRTVRTLVLNRTHHLLKKDEVKAPWVEEASSDERCDDKAVETVINLKFGKKRVAYDPSDKEGTKIAHGKGYTIIAGGSLTPGQWVNAKRAEAIKPAGQVTPSPKPYNPNGDPLVTINPDKWTDKMNELSDFYKVVALHLLGKNIFVVIANDPKLGHAATYGPRGFLVLNKIKLGSNFFENFPNNMENVLDLLLHELSHEFSDDHFSHKFLDSVTMLAGRLVTLALSKPEIFQCRAYPVDYSLPEIDIIEVG